MSYRLGVDVGGTFTDVALLNAETGELSITKVPSTPDNPSQGVLSGIKDICKQESIQPANIINLIHGTTVATNTTLEYKGAKTALITTEGFRDLLHIGRQIRPSLYDFGARRPEPLIPRNLRFEVNERVYSDGQVLKKLDKKNVMEVISKLKKLEVESIAVCLLHSYINPEHEKELKQIILENLPDISITISSDILPEFREYERMSTTVINAYVMPSIERYLSDLRNEIKEMGISSDLYIMQSNGGIIPAETAMEKSASTILSGPAGGVLGGQLIANLVNCKNAITVDMGGTSFDMCLLYEGTPRYTTESEIGGHPIKLPMIDIETIGSGGGSIAWIDKGKALRVGPQSAGADPGPVCYDKGGTKPTVTDANLILGRIGPDSPLIGEMNIDKAVEIIKREIADPLDLTVEEAAKGIIDVANANMVRGIRGVSVEKGFDPREFSLVAFGGAGPLHAADLARELSINEVIIPINPGISSAIGMLTADIRHDYVRTYLREISKVRESNLNSLYMEMEKEARAELSSEGVSEENMVIRRSADLRYQGQSYELNVEVPSKDLDAKEILELRQKLHKEHERAYGYSIEEEEVEFVNARITSLGKLPTPEFKREKPKVRSLENALKGTREVLFNNEFLETKILDRNAIPTNSKIQGPVIIEQLDSTTVVLPGQTAYVDEYKNILIRDQKEESDGS